MAVDAARLTKLRQVITENLRVQRGGADPVPYIDVSSSLADISARQNHVVFGRRGCGKTLLLHDSAQKLPEQIRVVYLNCEDFKNHTFPNVLIEILDALFGELLKHLTGWFGKKKKSREIIDNIRTQLRALKVRVDQQDENVKEFTHTESGEGVMAGVTATGFGAFEASTSNGTKASIERTYRRSDDKIRELNNLLPELKSQIRQFFELSGTVKSVFLQIDDFYHLRRADQPFVMDYLHRLCKDLPLYFKVATLRHASVLYVGRQGQPTGAQERHDYQPINVDFTFSDFAKTERQNRQILHAFAKLADLSPTDIDALFKGEGFARLVMAGGGVPRDVLSLFLEVVRDGNSPVGKDDVRILSRTNFEKRIEELKQDSEGSDQAALVRGIYVIRQFCLERQTNVFFVSEKLLQEQDLVRDLLYRLLDYRIIHSAATAITHKSQSGTYHAFVIDIGCYAHMRTLEGRFNEIDIADADAKERMRSSPILGTTNLQSLWQSAPADAQSALLSDVGSAGVG
jgi:hypothetical protein